MNDLVADKIYHPLAGMNNDSNGIGMGPQEAVDVVNLQITQSEVKPRQGTVLLGETTYTQPAEDILELAEYNDPTSGNILMAFCSTRIYKYVAGAGWQEVTGYDGVGGGLLEGSNINTWSITKALDDNIGATLVAAGSDYSRPTDASSGGADRMLIYYDRSANLYKELDLTSLFPVTAEDTGEVGPAATTAVTGTPGVTDATSPNYESAFTELSPGSFALRTNIDGVIAVAGAEVYSLPVGKIALGDASDGANIDCYRLIPSDDSKVLYGDDSYVRVDGLEWSCYFITADYQNHPILADYDYYYSVSYNPVFVMFYQNALLLFSTYEESTYFPWRMRHTEQGDITKTRTYFYQEIGVSDIGPITQVSASETSYYNTISSHVYVYKQNSIQRGTYNRDFGINSSGVLTPFMTFEKAYSEGLEAYRTLVNLNGVQIYLGNNDVYLFDGTERTSLTFDNNTGASRVREYLLSILNRTSIRKAFAVYDEDKKNYMLFLPTYSSGLNSPIDCLVYNIELRTWVRHLYTSTSSAINIFVKAAGTIGDLQGNIEDLQGNIEDLEGAVTKSLVMAQTKKCYLISNSPVDQYEDDENYSLFVSYLITRDFLGETLFHQDRWQWVQFEASGGILTVSSNPNYSKEPLEFDKEQQLEFGSTIVRKQYNIDRTTNSIRFMLVFGEATRLRWLQPFYIPMQLTNK